MNYDSRFMMNEGLLFLAYAYALSGFIPAAILLGTASAVTAVLSHSLKCLAKRGMEVLCLTLAALPLLSVSPDSGLAGAMGLLAFCSSVVSVLWMESSEKAIRPGMRILFAFFMIFLYLTVLVPGEMVWFLAGRTMTSEFLTSMVILMFVSPFGAYALRLARKRRKRVYNKSHSDHGIQNTADHTLY